MSDQIRCPGCRKLQSPQEEFGQLICPECAAVLPSPDSEDGAPEQAIAPGSSALDEAMPGQSRPTGAMTMLRNNLRGEERDKQSGWLENLLPRRGKGPANPELSPANPGPRDPESVTAVKKTPPGPHRSITETPDEFPSPAPIVVEKTAEQPPIARIVPDHREGSARRRISITGPLAVIVVGAIASVALLPGNEAWASVLFLLTVALLGVSFVAILHRRQEKRAFWQGFALFGCGYLVMAFVPLFPHQTGLELSTSRLLRLTYATATASAEDPRDSFEIMKAAPVAVAGPQATSESEDRPRSRAAMVPALGNIKESTIVGHCLFTLLAALIGSAIARWFYRSNLALS